MKGILRIRKGLTPDVEELSCVSPIIFTLSLCSLSTTASESKVVGNKREKGMS